MITIRPSEARGQADHGWLQSRHSFSFASYYDPRYMGVSTLRVINDDKVAPGKGFATHSHQDMEIISFVKQGSIEHKDSMGHIQQLPAGEFQVMSTGTGVTHSEYNPSRTESLQFLQIWIEPNQLGIEPQYQQKRFPEQNGLQLVASPDARDGSCLLHQDACLYHLRLAAGESLSYATEASRSYYLHTIEGQADIGGQSIESGDGVAVSGESLFELTPQSSFEALLFDLP